MEGIKAGGYCGPSLGPLTLARSGPRPHHCTMAKKLLLLGLLALTDAASISYPARSNLDFNFNNFGFKVRTVNKQKIMFHNAWRRPLQGPSPC